MKINREVSSIIEERMRLYEHMYGIEVLIWSLRGSMDVGIYRKNSDLDILFLYRSKNKDIRAIHDIVGHGFDYWGWLVEDAILTIEKSNEIYQNGETYLLSAEHKRASLDYYHGLYGAIGNEYAVSSEIFEKEYLANFINAYRRETALAWINSRLKKTIKKINLQERLTGSEILYGVWYALMSKHIITGNEPGDNKLSRLISLYATKDEQYRIEEIHRDYQISVNKMAKSYYDMKLYHLIVNQYENNISYIITE